MTNSTSAIKIDESNFQEYYAVFAEEHGEVFIDHEGKAWIFDREDAAKHAVKTSYINLNFTVKKISVLL